MALQHFSREETEGGVMFRAASGAGTIEVTRNGINVNLRNTTSNEVAEMPDVLKGVAIDYARLRKVKAVRTPDQPEARAEAE